ncbi:threonine/serine exporter family protein [uncultured Gemmiger sp.]|uniref:threonine/serine exporter family protein n=1 Tax=uncultured Gemmiger sp. TaxID=1623490 RepID=UPI0025F1C54F|nr:threonine/serine exporter family protein [uncultured Gemmiger sp.]
MAVSETGRKPRPTPMAGTGYRRALMLVIDAGSTLLENGGEVFRVQQTMQIMADSLGITDFNVYVLANGIFVSSHGRTEIRHVPATAIHLGRVEAVNELSRELAAGRLDLAGAEARLAEIRAVPSRRAAALAAASAAGSACFAYLFGGFLAEAVVALAAGAAESLLVQLCRKKRISRIFSDILSAAAGTTVALFCRAVLLPELDADTAIIGALMVLTPGVSLTMGVRDIINADYLSGAIRLLDAILVAGCLACGVGLAYTAAFALREVL